MSTKIRPINSMLGAAMALAFTGIALPALAGPPQPVTIVTQVVFDPSTYGTFTATGPICPTGIVELVDEYYGIGPAAFNVNATHRFTCDDNSGSFVIRLHPQGNSRPREGFDLDGPFSVVGRGTGAYENLSGSGWFGVVFNPDSDPLSATETYVGFVNL